MRILMLADRSFARREMSLIRRLEVGLLDEGHRVLRATPAGETAAPGAGLAGALTYDDRGGSLTRTARVRALVRDLTGLGAAVSGDGERLIDIVHVWGDGAWAFGLELAEEVGADVALEAWSAGAVRRRRRRIEARSAGASAAEIPGVWVAPDGKTLAWLQRANGGAWPVCAAPWGVHLPPQARPEPPPERPRAACILASGNDAESLSALLEAAASVVNVQDDLLLFLESAAPDRHPALWRQAHRLNLLDRLSIIADMESRRDVILRTDILILPEAAGEHRSIVLEAMAEGMAVVARADDLVEALIDGTTAALVARPTREQWRQALERVLSSPDKARALGRSAREYIAANRSVHAHVESVLNAYHALTGEPPLAFGVR